MPLLHVLAGPNGAGKSSFVRDVLTPTTGLPFVNADEIAALRWPDAAAEHSYDAARLAEAQRRELMDSRRSFITETVFSHPSKIDLVSSAVNAGYLVHLHVVMVPVDVTVQRVRERVRRGGHEVPEAKIRSRYARLWGHVAQAVGVVDVARVYDNSSPRTPFRLCAAFQDGVPLGGSSWPVWAPPVLRDLPSSFR